MEGISFDVSLATLFLHWNSPGLVGKYHLLFSSHLLSLHFVYKCGHVCTLPLLLFLLLERQPAQDEFKQSTIRLSEEEGALMCIILILETNK